MQAVQQKVALSQQLEELEMDMQVMLQEQLREKLVSSQSKQPEQHVNHFTKSAQSASLSDVWLK